MLKRLILLLLILALAVAGYMASPYRLGWDELAHYFDRIRPWKANRIDLQKTRTALQESIAGLRVEIESSHDTLQDLQQQVDRITSLQQQQSENLTALNDRKIQALGSIQQENLAQFAELQNQINEVILNYVSKAQLVTDLREAFVTAAQYHPVDLTLGPLPVNGAETLTYTIAETIPSTAREILVYAYVATNYVKGGERDFKIFVRIDEQRENAFYLHAFAFAQQAWAYNSENAWLPMPADRTLRVQADGETLFGNWNSSLRIIAYR